MMNNISVVEKLLFAKGASHHFGFLRVEDSFQADICIVFSSHYVDLVLTIEHKVPYTLAFMFVL